MNTFIRAFLFVLITAVFCVSFAIWYDSENKPSKPTFNEVDSLHMDSLNNRIDTIKIAVTVWKTKVKTIRETDTVIYQGTDTACIEIIERKNKRITALDTLCNALDEEARLYSDLNVVYLKRNATLSDSIGTITHFYEDSLNNVNKRLYSKFFKRNKKWRRNEFRNYVMTKATQK